MDAFPSRWGIPAKAKAILLAASAVAAVGAGAWQASRVPADGAGRDAAAHGDRSAPTLTVRGRYARRTLSGLAGLVLVHPLRGGTAGIAIDSKPDDNGFVVTATGDRLRGPCVLQIDPFPIPDVEPFDPVLFVRSPGAGEIDLGTLPPAGAGPAALEGRVVDEEGRGVAGAVVTAGIRVGNWSLKHDRRWATTDADGRFSCRAHLRGVDALLVELSGGWSSGRVVEVAPGARDLVLRAVPSFSRSGSVDLPADMPMEDLLVQICGPGIGVGWAAEVHARRVSLRDGVLEFAAQRSWAIEGIPAGTYDLFLRRRGASQPLAEQRDWDPRHGDAPSLFAEVPLRRLTVSVVDPSGAPLAGARVWLRESGRLDRFGDAVPTSDEGRAAFTMALPGARVAAHAPGYEFAFAGVTGDLVTLSLRESVATEVTLTCPERLQRPQAGTKYGVSLRWVTGPDEAQPFRSDSEVDDPRGRDPVESDFADDGTAKLSIAVPGWYSVSTLVRAIDGNWSSRSSTGRAVHVLVDGRSGAVERTLPESWQRSLESQTR